MLFSTRATREQKITQSIADQLLVILDQNSDAFRRANSNLLDGKPDYFTPQLLIAYIRLLQGIIR